MTANEKIFENQYQKVVEQNRQLQAELRKSTMQIGWNEGNNVNFGEFLLKRHSWCSFLNTTNTVGFIDIEFISDHHRKIYVGIGSGFDFNADVLNIAKYGTCIKDLGYTD